jgi:ATP-dependent protease ClpP protease subunit
MRHTGMTDEQIMKYTDRNFYMTPTMAKDLGVIDDVLGKPLNEAEKK